MGVEIERKFLLAGDGWRALGQPVLLRQGYLSSDPARVVRVRIEGARAMLTVKGPSAGCTRAEWEYPIPPDDAAAMLDTLCAQPLVEKYRSRIVLGPHTWEIDEFLGANQGLLIAEIELGAEDEAFDKPDWIGAEVTGQPRYYNARLIAHPYTRW